MASTRAGKGEGGVTRLLAALRFGAVERLGDEGDGRPPLPRLSPLVLQVGLRERSEDGAAADDVRGTLLVQVQRHQRVVAAERQPHLPLGAAPQHVRGDRVAHKVAEQQRVERDALRAARGAAANLGRWLERDGAVVGDRLPSEAEHHVSLAEHAARSAGGVHLADVHARPPLPQLEVRAQRRALHRLPREAERAPARVLSVRAEVVEEAGHHRGRDQVADVLRVVQRLKRDPDAAPRLECGPARVACDGGVPG